MKISELTSKDFLNNIGATSNSYVLINYEDSTTQEPVTYKTSLDTLGKAIATNLHAVTVDSSNGLRTYTPNGSYTGYNKTMPGWTGIDNTNNVIPTCTPSGVLDAGNIRIRTDKLVRYNSTGGYYFYGDGSFTDQVVPMPIYNENSGTLKYYNTDQAEYEIIPIITYDDACQAFMYYDTSNHEIAKIPAGGGDGGNNPYTSPNGTKYVTFDTDNNTIVYVEGSDPDEYENQILPVVKYNEDYQIIEKYDSNAEEYAPIPVTLYNESSGVLKYYNTDSSTYEIIPMMIYASDTLQYYDFYASEYKPVPMVGLEETDASLDEQTYRITFPNPNGQGDINPYAIADPYHLPGDSGYTHSLVVCDDNGHLFKVVAPSDSEPYLQAFTAVAAAQQ